MQWHMAAIIFGTCWTVALPSVVYFSIYRGGGFECHLDHFAFRLCCYADLVDFMLYHQLQLGGYWTIDPKRAFAKAKYLSG
jgi:hypothetical protein